MASELGNGASDSMRTRTAEQTEDGGFPDLAILMSMPAGDVIEGFADGDVPEDRRKLVGLLPAGAREMLGMPLM